ncbi:hypothetical protein N7G274_002856 [Stereocaulon virgatum]|uniref:Glucose-methanol-choline oxidoreductase N-terminal domain-containing protein n=1 Tax=Stereocaulon virgatum TaxID=373712 RepID=A0ABR4AJP9_9LECA
MYTINATKEVIVFSGSFRSPRTLTVSGIGPAATLQNNGIKVLAHRPGFSQNMCDHIFFGPSSDVDTVTQSHLGNPAFAEQTMQGYIASRTGISNSIGGDLLRKYKVNDAIVSPLNEHTLIFV